MIVFIDFEVIANFKGFLFKIDELKVNHKISTRMKIKILFPSVLNNIVIDHLCYSNKLEL